MVQKIEVYTKKDNRIETGALKIGDDWAGLFVRGDDAMFKLVPILEDWIDKEEYRVDESMNVLTDPDLLDFARWIVAETRLRVQE